MLSMKTDRSDHFMIHPEARMPNLTVWKNALKFYIRYHVDLLLIFPLLFLPIWTDCFHSVLVRQVITNEGKIHPLRAIKETLVIMPSFVLTKFILFFFSTMWSLIPIIGWYKDIVYRIRWAMVSNVHVFEGGSTDLSLQRSGELADIVTERNKMGAMVAVPILLIIGLVVFFMIISSLFQSSILFWVIGIALAWIIFPGAAVVNTMVYLSITDHTKLEVLTKP